MFHKHTFAESTNKRILFCPCGKIEEIPCCHDWKTYSRQNITFCGNEQIQEILTCENCGEIKSVNLTTGVISNKE